MTDFSVVGEIGVDRGPIEGVVVSADGRRLVTTNRRDDSVSVIDTAAGAVVSTISGLSEPASVACAGRDRAYVSTASAACDAIAAIDLRSQLAVAVHPVAFTVTDVVVSSDGQRLYASRTDASRADVVVLDPRTGEIGDVHIASAPGVTADNVRISQDGRRLYVSVQRFGSGQLVAIDARRRRIISRVEVGLPIRDVALSPNGATAYVVGCGPDFGTVLDLVDTRAHVVRSTTKIDGLGGFVTQLALSRDGERGYLVSADGVTVLSTSTQDVVGTIATANQPSCVVESPDGDRLYLADYSGVVTVVSIGSPAGGYQWALPEVSALEPARL